jgi:N6-L-threonylcarbamoyladenine synthase
MTKNNINILGIESSCDETACGIVTQEGDILSNQLYSQLDEHAPFGGVVPEVAARAHLDKIHSITLASLKEAKLNIKDIDLIAYTRGPGLLGPLLVGASYAQGLARSLGIDSMGINHLEGHIIATELSHKELEPPYVCLTVSGGHTELSFAKDHFSFELLGRTRDDAAGEAFDKSGKLLGLGYPSGPLIGKLAATGNRKFHRFPRSMVHEDHGNFSFSGLKTSVLRYVQSQEESFLQENINDICASLETAIVEVLVKKSIWALEKTNQKKLVIGGGVSANLYLREQMEYWAKKKGFEVYFPSRELSTDNGTMIAGVAAKRLRLQSSPPPQQVKPSLTLYSD